MHVNVYPRILRVTLALQSLYYFLISLWPLADMHTFETVTGPKTDVWLVKIVASQVLATAIFLAFAIHRNRLRTAGALGILTALSLGITETIYAAKESISDIYFVDALIELFFIAGITAGILIFQNSPKV